MSSLGTESLLQKHRQSRKNLRIKIYFLVTVGLFLFRVVWFAANFGSIEHDSGWFLGVAKNLANRGIYASYINTVEVEGAGVYPSLRRGLSIQDEKGFSYFPAGVTVGPGYVFPQALLLKIFGNGYWQYRLWPLITYMGLLFSLFYLVWSLAGMWGLVIFQIWLWAVPQMTTTFAYEGFGEHIALFYLLVGYCLFLKAYQGKRSKVFFFFAGFFFAFAILTKLLFLITLCAFLPVALWEAYTKRNELKRVFWRWISLFAGFVVPVFLFEIYRFASIVPIFGIHLWNILNANTRLEFLYGGSGLHTLGSFNWTFIFQKLMIWPDVGMSDSLILWLLFLLSPLLFVGRAEKRYFILVLVIYCGALLSFLWFILISQYGWTRHAWHSLILAMVLISGGLGVILRPKVSNWSKESIFSLVVVLVAIAMVAKFDRMEIRPLLDDKTIDNWLHTRSYRKRGIHLLGLPHAAIFSLDDQVEAVDFFEKHIQQEDRIYYSELFFVSEMATLADKVFYPLGRYFNDKCENPEGGQSYLIIGPYQQGRWSFTTDNYTKDKVAKYCENTVFTNESYTICSLKECDDAK